MDQRNQPEWQTGRMPQRIQGPRTPVRDSASSQARPVGYEESRRADPPQTGYTRRQVTQPQQPAQSTGLGYRRVPAEPTHPTAPVTPPVQTAPVAPVAPPQESRPWQAVSARVRMTGQQPGVPQQPTGPQPMHHTQPMTAPQPAVPAKPVTGIQPVVGAQQFTGPFEEPASSPEMTQERSEKLYTRDDPFWEHPAEMDEPEEKKKETPPSRPDGKVLRNVLLTLAVIAVVGFILRSTLFSITSISVDGNSIVTAAEVVRLSGLKTGDNILDLDEEAIARGVENNRYLAFICVDKPSMHSVVIRVRERKPAAVIRHLGMLYVMDNRGMVLEVSSNTEQQFVGMVQVVGLNIRNCEVGRTVALNSSAQMKLFVEILREMKVMSLMEYVVELDLSDMDNIYLATKNGFSVRLGDATDVHAKLRSMTLTTGELEKMGYESGTVDVSKPINPTYIPE